MKKSYFVPAVDVIGIDTTSPLLLTLSGNAGNEIGNGGNAGSGFSGQSKYRDDEEAYIATGGAGEASYGDLW